MGIIYRVIGFVNRFPTGSWRRVFELFWLVPGTGGEQGEKVFDQFEQREPSNGIPHNKLAALQTKDMGFMDQQRTLLGPKLIGSLWSSKQKLGYFEALFSVSATHLKFTSPKFRYHHKVPF